MEIKFKKNGKKLTEDEKKEFKEIYENIKWVIELEKNEKRIIIEKGEYGVLAPIELLSYNITCILITT